MKRNASGDDPTSAFRLKAFDFAQDSVKQLITLATGIIALTVTFLKDLTQDAPNEAKTILAIAWLLYFMSIGCGVLSLLNLTGTLETSDEPSIYRPGIIVFTVAQVVLFGGALALTLWFAASTPGFPTPLTPD